MSKKDWGPGPWQDEPDSKYWVQHWPDESSGYECAVIRHPELGNLCGYVGVPPGHPYWEASYEDIPVDVHGGLTFAGHDLRTREIWAYLWWVGFDCAHYNDQSPGMRARGLQQLVTRGSTYKTMDYVVRQTVQLADQLHDLAKKEKT